MIRYVRNIFIPLLILFVSVWLYLNISNIRENAIVMIKERVFKETGLHVEIGHFSLALPPTLILHDLVVRDDNQALVLEAKQGSIFVDLTDLLKRNFKKIWVDIEKGKLHSIPQRLLDNVKIDDTNNETKADSKLPEIFFSINRLEITPGVISAFDTSSSINFTSLKLKNVYFHSSGDFHEIQGKVLSDSLRFNDFIFHKFNAHVDWKLINNQTTGQLILTSLFEDKDVSIDANFYWPFGQILTVNAATLKFDEVLISDATAEFAIQELSSPPKDMQISAKKAVYRDLKLSDIDLRTALNNGSETQSSIYLTAKRAQYEDLELVNIDLKTALNSASKEHPLALKTEGRWKEQSFKVDTEVNYRLSDDQLQVAFKSLSGAVDAVPFALNEPGVFTATPQKISFEPLILTIDETVLRTVARIENNQFSCEGSVSSPKYPHADVRIQFPLSFSMHPFAFNFNPSAPLSGSISAEGDLATILQRLLDNPTSFSGRARALINLAGTLDSPHFTGNGEISNGSYEIPEIGVSLKDLSATIEVDGTKLNIKTVEAVDGKGGRLFGTGNYHMDRELNFPFSLELTLAEATLLNQDYVQVVCNGPLTFSGNSSEGSISAQLQVSKATVTIPERSYSTINTVDVTYINIPKDMPNPQSIGIQKSRWPLALDIRLYIESVLSISGKDLDSIWKGELTVEGSAKSPLLFGELRIISGQYLFNGNPFSINQGTITFAGDLDKKTTLYVIAGKDLDKVKVDVIAKGPVKNPVISFRSNPPLPQREILSWILFNRGTSEISPFQGEQLSESITNLSTQQQGPDVLSKIRSTLKIDRFEISRNPNSDDNSVNVEVGKYISDNILISVIKSDVNRVAVEANLTDNIKLRAQVGDDSQGQLLLKWKKDY